MFDFDDFLSDLLDGMEDLAKDMLGEHAKEALQDSKDFLEETKEDLERWTKLLAKGDISKEEFEWLVASAKGSAKMYALKEAGLTLIKIERFKNAVIDFLVGKVFALIF